MKDAKYTWLELLFSDRWQWVRKLSKQLWMKDPTTPGTLWVKFSDSEIETYKKYGINFHGFPDCLTEDWRD